MTVSFGMQTILNALDVNSMTLGDGGKNAPITRDGWYMNGDVAITQSMQINGKPKSVRTVLQERQRGLFQGNLKLKCSECKEKIPHEEREINNPRCCASFILSQQDDFKNQKSLLEEEIHKADMNLIFSKISL